MHAFLKFTLLLILSLVAAAVLTYPGWLLVELVSDQPVHRVMHRLAMLFALIGLVWLVRRLALSNRSAMGYAVSRAVFLRQAALGLICGLLLLLPFVGLLFALELRTPKDLPVTAALVAGALLSGCAVALIEETFFRGVLQTAVTRESGVLAGIVLPSALYASLHFLGGRLRIPDEEVTWTVGFDVLAKLFEHYAEPTLLIDSLLALFAVGLLLGMVRACTGSIAACMGLHAAWVAIIATTREVSRDNRDNSFDALTGLYDGVIGWGALVWTAILIAALLLIWRSRHADRTLRAATAACLSAK